jgi:hypothetical protein
MLLQHTKQLDSRRRSSGIQSLPSYIERCDAVLIPYLAPAQPAAAMTSSLASASGASPAATIGTTAGTSVGTTALQQQQQQKHRVFTTALKGGPSSTGSSSAAGGGSSSSGAARLDGKRSPTPSVRLFGGLPTAATAAMHDDDQVSTSPKKLVAVALLALLVLRSLHYC